MIPSPAPEWLRIQNELRARPQEQMLTPSQRTAGDALRRMLEFPNWINLRGPAGAGKTFLAWAIARQTGALHLPTPQRINTLPPGTASILIDNAPAAEAPLRAMLAACTLAEVQKVVVITRTPVQMPMRHVELVLPTNADWMQIEQTIQRLGVVLPSQRTSTLWEYLLACSQ